MNLINEIKKGYNFDTDNLKQVSPTVAINRNDKMEWYTIYYKLQDGEILSKYVSFNTLQFINEFEEME